MSTEPIGSISEIAMELTCGFCGSEPGVQCVRDGSGSGGMCGRRYFAGRDERNRRKAERDNG